MPFDFMITSYPQLPELTPEEYIARFKETSLPKEFISLLDKEGNYNEKTDKSSGPYAEYNAIKENTKIIKIVGSTEESHTCHEMTRKLSEDLVPSLTKDSMEMSSPVAAISGAGLMGCSIAAAFLQNRLPVLLFDIDENVLQRATRRIRAELELQLPELSRENIANLVDQDLHLISDKEQIKEVSFILETIPEKKKLKQKHYIQLDSEISPGTVLVSNTSTIRITELASVFATKCKNISASSFCGFHFFHPVRRRSLVEIIRGKETSDSVLIKAIQMARRIQKIPIVVNDGPGFLVNRLLNPYLSESMALLEEGVPLERIEEVCRRFGMEMGPFRIMDEIGLDVALHSGWTIFKEYPELISSTLLLPIMIEQGRLGRKSGYGFYHYPTRETCWESEPERDPSFNAILDTVQQLQSKYRKENSEMTDHQIGSRIFLSVLLEAGRIIESGIVSSFITVDMALVLGLGFPRSKGGICYWADSIGLSDLLTEARNLESLGKRFEIPNILSTISKEQWRLTQWQNLR